MPFNIIDRAMISDNNNKTTKRYYPMKGFFTPKRKKQRKGGFYWVRMHMKGAWCVGMWWDGYDKWQIPGIERRFYDNDLWEIDETPIVRYSQLKITRALLIACFVCALISIATSAYYFLKAINVISK